MKTVQVLNNSKIPIVSIDPSLEQYRDKVLFPEKLAKANEMLKAAILPGKNIIVYNVNPKEKGIKMFDAVITKTAKGAYMAQGNDGKGNKLTTLMGSEKALAAIAAGVAKQGWE